MKKPFVLLLIQFSIFIIALIYALNGLALLYGMAVSVFSLGQSILPIIVMTTVPSSAAWLLIRMRKRNIRKSLIVIFLWTILFIYPAENILGKYGLYIPKATVRPEQLLGASIVEIGRYVWLLLLIIWFGVSKKSSEYLKSAALPSDIVQAPTES